MDCLYYPIEVNFEWTVAHTSVDFGDVLLPDVDVGDPQDGTWDEKDYEEKWLHYKEFNLAGWGLLLLF
jgi:hypothetical protein